MFVIPMMGRSHRFQLAGYTRPKYFLPISGESMFSWAIRSFEKYFESDIFLFIIPREDYIKEFVTTEVTQRGLKHVFVAELESPTTGQACSVLQGLKYYFGRGGSHQDWGRECIVFNIDSHLKDFSKTDFGRQSAGYIEVFDCAGDRWSFVEPKDDTLVERVIEKQRISNLCCNGLYQFASCKLFFDTAVKHNNKVKSEYGEAYVAPLYNFIINDGKKVHYKKVPSEGVIDFGTPQDYQNWAKNV